MTVSADRTLTDDGVTAQTAKALRAAMQRLFAGQPQRTDGRLTKQNLWREAGVSRATMNRAHTILAEWDAHVAEHGTATLGEARRDEDIRQMKKSLADKTRDCTILQRRLDAAATVIAALHHDNALLREELTARGGTVVALHRSHDHDQPELHVIALRGMTRTAVFHMTLNDHSRCLTGSRAQGTRRHRWTTPTGWHHQGRCLMRQADRGEHPHADHVDGLPGVLRNRRVGAVVVSPHQTGAGAADRISATLAQRRIPEWVAGPGSRWRFGPSELTVLAPDPAMSEMHGHGEGSEINNSSVVLHVRWRPGSILLSGDLETEAQDDLLHRAGIRADILKTPHHGSNRQSPAFLSSVGARAALISVGADNDYGHPAPSTLALLRRLGAATYRTDQSGDLAVVERDGGLAVVPRGP